MRPQGIAHCVLHFIVLRCRGSVSCEVVAGSFGQRELTRARHQMTLFDCGNSYIICRFAFHLLYWTFHCGNIYIICRFTFHILYCKLWLACSGA